MTVELEAVTEADKPVLLNLVQLYCYDMSTVRGVDVTAHGLFTYRYIDHYFLERDRDALFLRHDGALAGFVMSRELSEGTREVAEPPHSSLPCTKVRGRCRSTTRIVRPRCSGQRLWKRPPMAEWSAATSALRSIGSSGRSSASRTPDARSQP